MFRLSLKTGMNEMVMIRNSESKEREKDEGGDHWRRDVSLGGWRSRPSTRHCEMEGGGEKRIKYTKN